MKLQKRSLSLFRLSCAAIFVFAAASVLIVLALAGVRQSSNEAVSAWRTFADQASGQQRALRAFVTQMGVGGFIDDYDSLVATGDPKLAPMIYGRGGAALGAIAVYPTTGATDDEIAARTTLQSTVKTYMAQIAPIISLHRQGRTPAEISRLVDVDGDGAAVSAALDTLANAARKSMMSNSAQVDSKALILLDLRRELGLEGLVQDADSYLITKDPRDLRKALEALTASRRILRRYRRHDLSSAEVEAFADLGKAIGAIETQLADGDTSEIKADGGLIQTSLLRLETLVYNEGAAAQNNLQSTLADVSHRSGSIIVIVAIGALVLVAGGVWLLAFRIGRRIKAITLAMRDLAAGKLDIDIPASGDGDEIGEMSRALLVFRDGLKANLALTQELAESSRLASLGAMVAGISHELNTPIGNALAVSSTLEDNCAGFRDDLASGRIMRSVLDERLANVQQASILIQRSLQRASEQIGAFKQMAVDQTSGQRREFALDDVLGSLVQTMTPLFKRTNFSLILGDRSGVVMNSYPGALSQVVANLVENGLKHGLHDRSAGMVRIDVTDAGSDLIRIVVSDDGAGIPQAILPRIFTAFFTTGSDKGGSGLGLHIVQSIISGPLGGEIHVESAEGRGARFVVTLPRNAPAPAQGGNNIPGEKIYYATAAAA